MQKCLFAGEEIIYRDGELNFEMISGSILLARERNYDITWVNEIESEFQCIVTNTHLDHSIDLFPINDFYYNVTGDFRSRDEE